MKRGLTILHTADSHIGADLLACPRLNLPRRGHDFVESFRRVTRQALADYVDLFIYADGLFDAPAPSTSAILAAGQALLDVALAGIPVVIVPGDHDRSAIPVSLLSWYWYNLKF